MQKIIIIVCLLSTCCAVAQKHGVFVRVFDSHGSKFHKGHLYGVTDSSLLLIAGKDTVTVPAGSIGSVKMYRSFGHVVGISTVITAATFAIVGVAGGQKHPDDSWDSWNNIAIDLFTYTPAEGALAGLAGGAVLGALTGSIIAGTRKRPVLVVDNSLSKWQQAAKFLKSYLNN